MAHVTSFLQFLGEAQCRSVVIFEGKQDIGKSELVKRLAGEAWYRIVDSTLEGKEAHMLMKGVWIVELAEMDVLLRTEESRVKSFVTMCNDEYVPKYANDPVKLARRTILVGTINPTATLLEHALLTQGFMGGSKAGFLHIHRKTRTGKFQHTKVTL